MTTITEDYVSFETAKLLKEKAFNEASFYGYNNKAQIIGGGLYYSNDTVQKNIYTAPTLQMAMKWLREVHHIFIQVELYSKYNDYCFELFQNTHRLILKKHETYNSYEETCEAAIKYCLKYLI